MADLRIRNGKLTSYSGDGGDVVVPEGVTSIGSDAFLGTRCLQQQGDIAVIDNIFIRYHGKDPKYIIPKNITVVADSAFFDCSSLTSITLPASVTSIGNGAFQYCSSLNSITIPAAVTSIGEWAFFSCRRLTIHAPANSAAQAYAEENRISFQPLTK